jgi:hypothetical protein
MTTHEMTTSTTAHVKQPVFCEQCASKLLEAIEQGKVGEGHYYCPHELTVAKIHIANKAVINWVLFGPRTEEQAKQLVASLVVINAAADMMKAAERETVKH